MQDSVQNEIQSKKYALSSTEYFKVIRNQISEYLKYISLFLSPSALSARTRPDVFSPLIPGKGGIERVNPQSLSSYQLLEKGNGIQGESQVK